MQTEKLLPITSQDLSSGSYGPGKWGESVIIHDKNGFPDLKDGDLAIIGVEEDGGDPVNDGSHLAPNTVRKALYELANVNETMRIVDIGNISPQDSPTETYMVLSDVIAELLDEKILPIVIGGSHDLTIGQYRGCKSMVHSINLVVVDSKIDLENKSGDITADNFLRNIFDDKEVKLSNFAHLGHQSFYVNESVIQEVQTLKYEAIKLGDLRNSMEEVEPIIRNGDLLSLDISAIRQSDAPGHKSASPNGFYAEQACQITRYAGISDNITSLGIYGVNPEYDNNGQTSQLAAQMIWYFVDGYYSRKNDFPKQDKKTFTKYTVPLKEISKELIFWQSDKSGRWWVEIPVGKDSADLEANELIPCSYADYETANKGDLPDRWFKAYEKLS
ncbi:MAG: formimidoylglutamase [Bacteroidetes bacterium]|nr:formimidoylglutamase [Bacteroidota bacterium]